MECKTYSKWSVCESFCDYQIYEPSIIKLLRESKMRLYQCCWVVLTLIDKQFGEFYLYCDICGEQNDETFETFQDAVDAKKEAGWKSQKTSKGWNDICLECQE